MKKTRSKAVRLSKNVIPERYKLLFKPDLQAFTFLGEETIFLNIKKETNSITLHSKNLDIEVAEVRSSSVRETFALKISYDKDAETAAFLFPKKIPAGKAELKLVFRGILNTNMRGFYQSHYVHEGVKKVLATTQFEAADARGAFPSFDEPEFKAEFEISVMTPPGMTAISNTIPIATHEHEGGYKVVDFSPTPKMSTYLAAFIVGEFESLEKKSKNGTIVRVSAVKGKGHQGKFALDCSVKFLEFYEKYFDIPYPLPSLDLIAIPDFEVAGMENWGAITFREAALLFDPDHSSTSTKQQVALVVAHEIAHQWFGNLVTMEWWTHLWLNEGFASYIEYVALDHVFPEWDMWTQFSAHDLARALRLDALKSTHPIEVEVHHPDELAGIFDAVSYSKGASIIRMLAAYLGEKDFRNGLSYYLKKHSYGNASTAHLWEAFEKISKKPVRRIMQMWTSVGGHPVITIEKKGTKLQLSQERFFSSPISQKANKEKTLWQIPMVLLSGKKEKRILMGKKKMSLPYDSSLIKLNSNEVGMYRVRYPKEMLENLGKLVKSKKLPPSDRLGIVRDIFALAESGKKDTTEALALLGSYVNEDDYTVWTEIATGLSEVSGLIYEQSFYGAFKNFKRQLLEPLVKKLGWVKKPNEKHTTALLRSLVLLQAGLAGDEKVISQAQKYFQDFLSYGTKIAVDIRAVVYTIVGRFGGMKEHQALLTMYKEETLQEEKTRIGRGLANFKDEKLLQKTLEFALSEHVRFQDGYTIVAMVWRSLYGSNLAWNFVKKNWNLFLERYGGGMILFHLLECADIFSTKAHAEDIKKFFKTHPAPSAEHTIKQVLEKINSNVLWLERDKEKIKNWLK